jgi:hypothetical protein
MNYNDKDQLFKEVTTNDVSQVKPNEDDYTFIVKSNTYLAKVARKRLNDFFNNVPSKDKESYRKRIPKQFLPTFYELFLYDLFVNLNYDLTEHPVLRNSGKQPDFLCSKLDEKFYLEAKVYSDITPAERKLINIQNEILTKLSRITSKFFLYNVEQLDILTPSISSLKDFYNAFKKKMQTKPTSYKTAEALSKYDDLQCNRKDVIIKISFIHNSIKQRGIDEDELMATRSYPTIWGFENDNFSNSVTRKIKRYGKTEYPLVVAFNVLNHWKFKRLILEEMLFGEIITEYENGYVLRKKNGLFNNNSSTLDHVSGVIFSRVYPYNDKVDLYHYLNPKAKVRLSIVDKLNTFKFLKGQIICVADGTKNKYNNIIKKNITIRKT